MRKMVRLLALSVALSVAALVLLPMHRAVASQGTVVANTSSAWQTNGVVWALGYAHGVIYLGGDFTTVRPPGAAAGVSEVTRNRIAAFNATTGGLLPFTHDIPAHVAAITASPDGNTIYVGGDFTTVDGLNRPRLAAFDTSTGALKSWAATTTAPVRGLAVSVDGTKVYIGGQFGFVDGQARSRLGAVNATTGALDPNWAPSADAPVTSVAVAPDGSRVFVGGYFSTLNGAPRRATGSLDPVDGSNEPWASAGVVPPRTTSCDSNVKDVAVDASNVYFAAEGNGGGCFDGTFAARQSVGALVWRNDCLGATQAVEPIGSFVYKGSHAHNCSASGGFPEVPDGQSRHLLAQRLGDGSLGPWYPNTNGQPLGPRVFATDGNQLFVGGDFTSVNNQDQQGFTRFQAAPDLTNPHRPDPPAAVSITSGTVAVSWRAVIDEDDTDLIYRVYRDGGTTPVYTSPVVTSTFWNTPTLSFQDTGLAPGSTHTYRVDAKEAFGANVGDKSSASTSHPRPPSADYNGDGKADVAVFRPSNGTWYVRGITTVTWGRNGDVPVPGDYNGDGRTDVAVFRPSNGTWYVRGITTVTWGRSGDIPLHS
jgi:large repetitive protein